MPQTTTNDGEQLVAQQIDEKRQAMKGLVADNFKFKGYDGTQHAVTVWNPNTNGLGLLVQKSDALTTLLDVRDSGITLGAALTLGGSIGMKGPIYDVTAYGADKTGATASDAAIASAIAAIPSTGGALYFPFGAYIVNSPIVINKPMVVYGDVLYSGVSSTSATNSVFQVTQGQSGQVIFRHLNIDKTAAGQPSTAGYGIDFTPTGGTDFVAAPVVEHCRIANQWIGLNFKRAISARVLFNSFAEQRSASVQFDYDVNPWGGGDHFLMGNFFSNGYIGTTVGVQILGGAGFTIALNKFIGYQVQCALNVQNGRLNQSDLWIWNNSMEAQPDTVSLISLQGLEAFDMIKVENNQMVISKNGGAAVNALAMPSFTFTADPPTDVLTTGAAHGLIVGDRIYVTNSGGALPTGMAASTIYYVKTVPTTTTLTVSATSGGATLDITAAGAGTHTLHQITLNNVSVKGNTIKVSGSGAIGTAIAGGDNVSLGANDFDVVSGGTAVVVSTPGSKVRQSLPNDMHGDGAYLTGSFTTAQPKIQGGTVGATTNAAEGGVFITPSTAITYPEPFYAAPRLNFNPTSAACIGGRFLSHVTSGGRWTGANVLLIGSANATALTATYDAKADA